ncbi:class I SAM-dependent RNA methyltransferase [Qipengyuania marisflavi]|uniref:Class I SAM-dependent RNA methyltransferase n=1 Tax=Qipengyuania marisflavi TaxID=2486356 RepID=A0A5S3P9M0_9SPHN|nr:class I SAM-dependent RNA methyltransferase [Qipengyuania marisflavi]TMM50033.1 class I SAM-dependent RNA methyltransferase [Qipengyuania marisflavi]
MSNSETIIRIAAKGDGVTAQGRHVAGSVPGDVVAADGTLTPGPHHVAPPCRHFGKCGGCQLQYADDIALAQFVTERVMYAAEGQGVAVGELLATHLSPPRSRRRATLHGLRRGKSAELGFREGGSHRIVDMRECHILTPELFALVAPLRALIAAHGGKRPVDAALTLTDQGIDCTLTGLAVEGLGPTEALLDFARDNRLARLAMDEGYGPETTWEPDPVTMTLGGVAVPFPAGAFLQPTRDGEDRLIADARSFLEGAGTIADLFSGLGTFAFALAGPAKVLAAEAARDAHLACKTAANARGVPVHALHRDLFRNPLQADEAGRFDALLLDPPRAGARDQIAAIAASTASRVAYISCNPASWGRDAKTLQDAGFRLEKLRPVGQFRWSSHVELTSLFLR